MPIPSKPKIAWLNHRGERFPRGSFKSFSYRYEVAASAPGADAIVVPGTAIIETRYRGQSASWNLQPSMLSPEVYRIGGTFVHPAADNILVYPPKPAEVTHASARPPETLPPATRKPIDTEMSAVSEDRKEALREFTRRLIARAFGTAGATP